MKRLLLLGILPGILLAIGYTAYPYVTMWRIGHAVDTSDVVALESLIDWQAVREGFKSDLLSVAAPKTSDPRSTKSDADQSGSALMIDSFLAGTVNARSLIIVKKSVDLRWVWRGIEYAFFESPTTFRIDVVHPHDKLRFTGIMSLRGGEWRLSRIDGLRDPEKWIPRSSQNRK
jgi:hypothetical protein